MIYLPHLPPLDPEKCPLIDKLNTINVSRMVSNANLERLDDTSDTNKDCRKINFSKLRSMRPSKLFRRVYRLGFLSQPCHR